MLRRANASHVLHASGDAGRIRRRRNDSSRLQEPDITEQRAGAADRRRNAGQWRDHGDDRCELTAVGGRKYGVGSDDDRRFPRGPYCAELLHRTQRDLHAPDLHDYRLRQPELRVSVPRVRIRRQWSSTGRTCAGGPPSVPNTIRRRAFDNHRLSAEATCQ